MTVAPVVRRRRKRRVGLSCERGCRLNSTAYCA